jgi:hypothetical protein
MEKDVVGTYVKNSSCRTCMDYDICTLIGKCDELICDYYVKRYQHNMGKLIFDKIIIIDPS